MEFLHGLMQFRSVVILCRFCTFLGVMLGLLLVMVSRFEIRYVPRAAGGQVMLRQTCLCATTAAILLCVLDAVILLLWMVFFDARLASRGIATRLTFMLLMSLQVSPAIPSMH